MILCTQISALLWVNYWRKLLVKYVMHITARHRLSPYRNYQLPNFTATKFHTKIQNLMTHFTNSLGIMPDYFWRLYTQTWALRPEPCWCTHIDIQTVTLAKTWKQPSGLLFLFFLSMFVAMICTSVSVNKYGKNCIRSRKKATHTHTMAFIFNTAAYPLTFAAFTKTH